MARTSSTGLGFEDQLSTIVIGQLTIDLTGRCVWLAGEVISFSSLQFELLAYLATRAGQAVPLEKLLLEVWGVRTGGTANQVDCCLKKLRAKIESRPEDPDYFHKQHKRYRMVTDAEWREKKLLMNLSSDCNGIDLK